jgi:hypothetical protein
VGNHAPLAGGIHFDLPIGFQPKYVMQNCLVADNTDDAGNIGLLSQPGPSTGPNLTHIHRCTFANNRVAGDETLKLTLSIVRGATPPLTASGSTVVQYSNIEGGWAGPGNFDADPLFVDAAHSVYRLTAGSPCVDAGLPGGGSDPDGSTLDVGYASLTSFAAAPAMLFGASGLPVLTGTGSLQPLTSFTLSLTHARPLAGAILVLGFTGAFAPLKGGLLVPAPVVVIPGLPVAANGSLALDSTWPAGVPSGLVAWVQHWIPDDVADEGLAASNGLALVAP